MRPIAYAAILLLCWATNVVADAPDSFCRSVEASVNTLADFTKTKCLVTAGRTKGQTSIIVLSQEPVFSNEAAKKAWLIVACGAAGSELNKKPKLVADEIWFSDVERTRNRTAFVTTASTCKSLQAKAHSGSIDLEQMYGKLTASLVRKEVSK